METPTPAAKPTISPTELTPEAIVHMCRAVGQTAITEAMIEADVRAGAPVNPDGTIHLVHYCAWLVREVGDVRRHP